MIINLDSYRFYISRPEEDARSDPKMDYTWLAPLHNEDTKYFYIEVLDGNNFSVFDAADLIPAEVMESIRQKEVTLAIANSGHGYHELVGDIYANIVLKYNIDPTQILLISESADIHLELEAVAAKYNVEKCKLQWTNEFDKIIKDQLSEYVNINTLEHKEYTKKFLSWNGMFRPHRTALIYLLECYDLLNQGYVSYNIRGGQPNDIYEWIYDSLGYNEEFKKLIEDNTDKLLALPEKIFIDDPTANLVTHPGDSSFYENTYFSLVTETSFPFIKLHYGNFYTCLTDVGRILSEKIFKPIGLKHPFIVVSNPRTLELLRTLGYKTFSPWIDESYDLIEDDSERLLAIVKETKRLCDLNPQELSEFLDNCKEICEYNREVMMSKTITDYRHNIIL
jgi:hypothetical protein